jgi:hypothetical protein
MQRESIYWFFVALTLIYILFKNFKRSINVLIIICFYSGLASFLGKGIENPYKIVVVILSVYGLVANNGLSGLRNREGFLLTSLILFSISFLFSGFINGDYFTLIFSQYGKYITPFCIFFIFNRIMPVKPEKLFEIKYLLFSLLTIQIILSAIKILTLGLHESTVGSIVYIGGGAASILPVLGFILLWLDRKGEIKRKDWVYTILLLFIGFASVKRAIWFIMPAFIFLFMIYVSGKVKRTKLLYYLPLIPVIFYSGIRLNPSLNKEHMIGGSFDLQYVTAYVQKYSFGKTAESTDIQLGQGRGGATLLLFDRYLSGQPLSFNDYFGYGLKDVYTTSYEGFNDEKYGVNSKGSVTGIFQSYIATGFIGVIATILLMISITLTIKEPRFRIAIAILMLWDYLFYIGLILRSQSLFILLFFIIIYSNFQYNQRIYKNRSTL